MLALLALGVVLLLSQLAAHAAGAGSPSPVIDARNGFPTWYQDNAGNRVDQCIDTADANCVLLPSASFNPANPVVFPTNFPDEFFYALADSENIPTVGCGTSAPGRASVRIALEGAFVNGLPAPNEQMVFGRIRVKVTSGLCPDTQYKFVHPYGTEILTTNGAGAIPANVGTEDIGCVPTPLARCDFTLAGPSRVFGSGTDGFLRWDPASGAAPAGYLGDGATLHQITGATAGNPNAFEIRNMDDTLVASTSLFSVAGRLAGSLTASTGTLDFAGQPQGTPSGVRTVTFTNVDTASVTLGAPQLGGAAGGDFAVVAAGTTCTNGLLLARDATCTVALRFTPSAAGARDATLSLASNGGVRSPLSITVTGTGTAVAAAPALSTDVASLAFGGVRVRTTSPRRTITVSNTGTAPLEITSVFLPHPAGDDPDEFLVLGDTCVGGAAVAVGGTCTIDVMFAPMVPGAHTARVRIVSNAAGSPTDVVITGTGTGGVAAVSATTDPSNHFADWYRDEAGITVGQCIDAADPNCIVLPDANYDPARGPVHFADNFPAEFFYQVATSDNVTTPGCAGSDPGRAFVRTALEGTFTGPAPVDGTQMVFGRIRIVVRGGLCADTQYRFIHPYGTEVIQTDDAGAVKPAAGTEDIGCVPTAASPCDYSQALSSRVLGGLVSWDPAFGAAPAGYLGDGVSLHRITGAPYRPDGTNPANYFRIERMDGTLVAETRLFTVMGKLRGPLEATPEKPDLGHASVGTSVSQTVTLTNTGTTPLNVNAITMAGTDAGDFTVAAGTCASASLTPGTPCTITVTFQPTAVGTRSATVQVQHSGLNNPLAIPVTGTGDAPVGNAAISFSPRSVAFAPLHVGRTSGISTVTISNAGGTAPLVVNGAAIGGANPAAFAVAANRCAAPVPVDGSCEVDVVFTPDVAGPRSANLVITDNAPGGTHTVPLTGTASAANAAVSGQVRGFDGFPLWYQDASGTRLEPCLDASDPNCIVLGDAGFVPDNALNFPSNYPGEFFYAVADSDLVSTPGCAGTPAGTAFIRVALEGSFLNGTPIAGDQMTFARIRVVVTSGLCANTTYTFVTPYGAFNYTTNGNGGIPRNGGTINVGCTAAPCTFNSAFGPLPVPGNNPADSFLRWDPNVGPAAPDGYLGDAVSFHRVTGGTYIPAGAGTPVNHFAIQDSAGNTVGITDRFMVSGKLAGPLQTTASNLTFGNVTVGNSSAAQTVTITGVRAGTPVSAIGLTDFGAGDFQITGGTCVAGTTVLALDQTCTVQVRFSPATAGNKAARLRVAPATGQAVQVDLTGTADTVGAPAATVTPGVLAFGTVTAGAPVTLTTTVRNTGTAPLSFPAAPAIAGTGAADYAITANGCTVALAPGAQCQISVRFSPTAIGARSATLTIPHNATGGSTAVSLSGTGNGSTFSISPSPVKFGTVNINTTKTQTVTVKNTGTLAFRLNAAATDNPLYTVAGPGCIATVIQPGKTCNITVSYRPTAAVATTANLTVTGDATSLPGSVGAQLTGTGR
ncbi:MAG: choice-of-anchor D domain-containing protein [Thermoleophilia bacterium]